MRTTLDIEDDVLAVAKEMARRQQVSAGQMISRLLREAMSGASSRKQPAEGGQRSVAGFQPFPSQGVLITDTHIDSLRDTEGV